MNGIGEKLGVKEELFSFMTKACGDREREVLRKKRMMRDRETEKKRLGEVTSWQAFICRAKEQDVSEEEHGSPFNSEKKVVRDFESASKQAEAVY